MKIKMILKLEKQDDNIILINGTQLAEYMIESDTGVLVVEIYKIKKIDQEYFQGS